MFLRNQLSLAATVICMTKGRFVDRESVRDYKRCQVPQPVRRHNNWESTLRMILRDPTMETLSLLKSCRSRVVVVTPNEPHPPRPFDGIDKSTMPDSRRIFRFCPPCILCYNFPPGRVGRSPHLHPLDHTNILRHTVLQTVLNSRISLRTPVFARP